MHARAGGDWTRTFVPARWPVACTRTCHGSVVRKADEATWLREACRLRTGADSRGPRPVDAAARARGCDGLADRRLAGGRPRGRRAAAVRFGRTQAREAVHHSLGRADRVAVRSRAAQVHRPCRERRAARDGARAGYGLGMGARAGARSSRGRRVRERRSDARDVARTDASRGARAGPRSTREVPVRQADRCDASASAGGSSGSCRSHGRSAGEGGGRSVSSPPAHADRPR